ncbi:hypothetical protein [Bifidobacterium subtile]|jgi:hypothetical protein|uniref:C4-dicarboxylate ABC transporter n=1 Tax=Bifidobacterium subtile TaxID=77635 RepID=A0A087E1W7_9BIFI|nr:hypothetical protein [Bifidobacterium subtile]KFJ01768.1 C4-dicarboxylate ABC transporter [Bifidobacterium subtile]QOL37243.1 hypothetical protein BS3272_04875 [Bifidobacterium subtile]
MWFEAIPAALWVLSALICIGIAVLSVVRSHYGRSSKPVRPVGWNVAKCHILSLITGLLAYLVYLVIGAGYAKHVQKLYTQVGFVSAIVLAALIIADVLLLILQSRRAERSHIDEVLSGAVHTF